MFFYGKSMESNHCQDFFKNVQKTIIAIIDVKMKKICFEKVAKTSVLSIIDDEKKNWQN